MNTITPAQKRAIEWLPADGSWRTDAGRLVGALSSAWLHGFAEGEWADCGARGGRKLRWRLRPAGIVTRAELDLGVVK
jgi:hypothetical protein